MGSTFCLVSTLCITKFVSLSLVKWFLFNEVIGIFYTCNSCILSFGKSMFISDYQTALITEILQREGLMHLQI